MAPLRNAQRFSISTLWRRRVEVTFFGDYELMDKVRSVFASDYPPEEHVCSIQVGERHVLATFQPGFQSGRRNLRPPVLLERFSRVTAAKFFVVLCDVNKPMGQRFSEFVKAFENKGDSVLWITGIWQSCPSSAIDNWGSYTLIPRDNAENLLLEVPSNPPSVEEPGTCGRRQQDVPQQRKNEKQLRGGVLKSSLKKGAHYVRWKDTASLRDALEAFLDGEDVSSAMLANKKIPEFQVVFTNEMDVTETKDYLEINEEDIVIIVMGATGSGKSSFIKNATGYDLRIGEEADSCTQNLQVIRMLHGDRKIYLVDTPGFNDTNTSDIKIFNLIANWLRDRFINDVYVSGVVYLHKISDTRIGGIARRNFQVFEQLCGRECFHKVMLATTMWNEETEEDGQKKETQLKDRYFKSMMQQDAKLRRLDDDQDSAQRLLTAVINNATNLCPLLLQKELVSLHKSLPETHAGQYLYRKLGDILCTKQDKLAQLHSNSAEAGDALLEFVQLQKEIQEIMKEMQENRLSMPTRLMQFLQSRFR